MSANNISFINVPAGYKAVVTQTRIPSVEVVGPKENLERITTDQLFAEVDLSSADPTQSHGTAYARAYVKDSNNCWVHNRYTVSYRLEKSSNGKIKLSANAESAIRQVTGTAVLTAVPVIA